MQFSDTARQILACPVRKFFPLFYFTGSDFSEPYLPELDTGHYSDTNENSPPHLTLFLQN